MCSESIFFFNDTATTEIYTLSLHDALPISLIQGHVHRDRVGAREQVFEGECLFDARRQLPGALHGELRIVAEHLHAERRTGDRKSTRLNSSHGYISYAVFCLYKKTSHASDS